MLRLKLWTKDVFKIVIFKKKKEKKTQDNKKGPQI